MLYDHFFRRRLRDLPTMLTGKKVSAALEISLRWDRLFELELFWSLQYCAIIDHHQHVRVLVLTMDLLDLILDSIPDNLMGLPYSGGHYGTPLDTIKGLLQANAFGRRYEDEVVVSILSETVRYVSLDQLLDKSNKRQELCELLPVEDGAIVSPLMKAKLPRAAKEKA